MRAKRLRVGCIVAVVLFACFANNEITQAALTTNNFTGLSSGKWENAGNWSAGIPSFSQTCVQIANGVSAGSAKTVSVDAVTVANAPGSLTVSNLIISGSGPIQNTLFLNSIGTNTLQAFDELTISDGAAIIISNSVLFNGPSAPFHNAGLTVDGLLVLNSGTLLSSVELDVGFSQLGQLRGVGQLTTLGGTWLNHVSNIGSDAGSSGTWNIGGGTSIFSSQLIVGLLANATGSVWMAGGLLMVTNATTYIGEFGVGQMTMSNGTWEALETIVGEDLGSQGTFTVAGGANVYVGTFTDLIIGDSLGATGAVWVTGGQLLITNFFGDLEIGNSGSGFLTQSNGVVHAFEDDVGESPGGQGTLTVAGGNHIVDGGLYVGDDASATGAVWITGGQLVTSNTITSVGESGIGRMTVSNGTWLAHNVFLGDSDGAEGSITMSGGSAIINSSLVIANSLAATGIVSMTGGLLTITNNETDVGYAGVGRMTISGGAVLSSNMVVGNLGGSRGTFTMSGGTNTVPAGVTIGNLASATGAVWETGGQLDTGFQSITVGSSGVGQMTVSNGTVLAAQLAVAFGFNSRGTFTLAGGTVTPSILEVGLNTATGAVWVTGGQLSPFSAQIGRSGKGLMTISNGTVKVGSTMTLGVGIIAGFSQGSLAVEGGSVGVTNGSGTAVLIVGQADAGTFTQDGGIVTVDNLLVTNLVNSVFTFNGGTFQTKATTVSNTHQFVVGNAASAATYHLIGGVHSFNNGLRIRNDGTLSGCGTINGVVVVDAGGTVVADCGGSLTFNGSVTNNGTMKAINGSVLEGYGSVVNNGLIDITGGTTNFHGTFINNGSIVGGPVSAFAITSIAKQDNNIFISWQTSIGETNALQETAGGPGGSYNTNGFTDIFIVTNTLTTTTNYLDVGAATNKPSRFYRVRLVP